MPWLLIKVDQGEPVPSNPSVFSGLSFMGGPMSVNDPLPWVDEECALIRAAVAADIPVLGHCLGGQLMSKALGGQVTKNLVKEIGWGEVSVADTAAGREWLGGTREFLSFHWHGETFSLPPGASPILGNRHCANQAFALGKHLAMQCHVEMTEAMIRLWNSQWADEVRNAAGPGIQAPAAMYQNLSQRLAALNGIAAKLYTRWINGLRG